MHTNIQSFVRAGVVLVLGSLAAAPAMAASDSKYPAADFSPSVIYSNPELVGKTTASHGAGGAAETHAPDPKYPAAYFQPSVIHKAENHAAAPAAAPAPQHDPKYPAAYFEPKVIHPAK
jgi:hypothetical protein